MDWMTIGLLAGLMIAAGAAGGMLAGLLGVGGGIVVVPMLDYVLGLTGAPAHSRIHVAVATSLATIVPTAISSSRAHHARSAIDWRIAKSWGPAIGLGALAGSLLAAQTPSRILTMIFGVVALAVSAKMFLPLDQVRLSQSVPRGAGGQVLAAMIGGVSAIMGIGGGTLSVPALTLSGEPIHRAVGTAAFFGLLISLPGTLGFLLMRPDAEVPPFTVGYVSLLGFALIAPTSWLTAPLGAHLAHNLSRRTLSITFGFFLMLVAARMFYRSFLEGP